MNNRYTHGHNFHLGPNPYCVVEGGALVELDDASALFTPPCQWPWLPHKLLCAFYCKIICWAHHPQAALPVLRLNLVPLLASGKKRNAWNAEQKKAPPSHYRADSTTFFSTQQTPYSNVHFTSQNSQPEQTAPLTFSVKGPKFLTLRLCLCINILQPYQSPQ